MKKYTPVIKNKKSPPLKTPKMIIVLIWCLFGIVLALDTFRFVGSPNGISVSDIFWDVAIFVVAIYLTLRNRTKK